MSKGFLQRNLQNILLVTVEAACNALQHYGAPDSTLAAVQGLQWAEPVTPEQQVSMQVKLRLTCRVGSHGC